MAKTKSIICLMAILPQAILAVQDICNTPRCNALSKNISDLMDTTVDPCQDFHQYSCGGYLNKITIPDGVDTVNPLWDKFGEIIELRGKRLLEMTPENQSPFVTDEIARNYYKKCMDESAIEEAGLSPIKNLLDEIGGWPVLKDNWVDGGSQWYDRDRIMNSFGIDPVSILHPHVFYEYFTNQERIIFLDQPKLGLEYNYLREGLTNSKVQQYYNYMVESAVLMGAGRDRAETEMKKALEFEIEIAKIYDPGYKNPVKLHNSKTVRELEMKWNYPSTFRDYINNIFVSSDDSEIQVDESEQVLLLFPTFFDGILDLLKNTPSVVVANYQAWRAYQHSVPNLNKAARELEKDFIYNTKGVNVALPRWKKCVREMGYNFDVHHARWDKFSGLIPAAASLYLRHHFPSEKKEQAENMLDNIDAVFKNILSNAKWMSNGVKEEALKKLESQFKMIGGPNEFYDSTVLNEVYKNFVLGKDYFGNARKVEKFWRTFDWELLRVPVKPESWVEHPYVLLPQAFAVPFTNSNEFAAGIILEEVYDTDAPGYMNFARLGAIYGHEKTHHFSGLHSLFDSNRNFKPWWDATTKGNYGEKSTCFKNQYGNYHVSQVNMNVNGENSLGENIADNGGINIAYYAYEKYVKKQGSDQLLKGLDFNQKKLFFITHAQMRCLKMTDERMREQLASEYAPAKFRINGALSNFEKFSEVFGCSSGSEMNRNDKCKIW